MYIKDLGETEIEDEEPDKNGDDPHALKVKAANPAD